MLFSATRVCALLPQPREADSLPGAGRASLRPCGLPGLPVGSSSPTDGGLGHAPGLGLRSVSSGQAGRAGAQRSLAQRSLAPFSPPLRTAHLLFSPGPGMGSGRGRGAELQPARGPLPREERSFLGSHGDGLCLSAAWLLAWSAHGQHRQRGHSGPGPSLLLLGFRRCLAVTGCWLWLQLPTRGPSCHQKAQPLGYANTPSSWSPASPGGAPTLVNPWMATDLVCPSRLTSL